MESREIAGYIEKCLVIMESSGGLLKENSGYWISFGSGVYYACILGMAFIGKVGNPREAYQAFMEFCDKSENKRVPHLKIFADFLDCDLLLAKSILYAHASGIATAQIAAALRTGTLPAWAPK